MELRELVNTHYAGHEGRDGYLASLRLRKTAAQEMDEHAVNYDWGPSQEGSENREPEQSGNLRGMLVHLSLKRAILHVQQMRVPEVSTWGSRCLRCCEAFRRFREDAQTVMVKLEPWRKEIHKIGGNFGGGIQSYFLFLRFIIVLNFLSFLLMAAFVIIPNIVYKSFRANTSESEVAPDFINLTEVGVCLPDYFIHHHLTPIHTHVVDFLSGTGFMTHSYLFYGFYNNSATMSEDFVYNIPLAYLLTAAFYFLFCLTCIIIRMCHMARVVAAAGGKTVGGYSILVFTGWDYGLQGNYAVRLKQNNLRYQLQMDLEEERLKRETASLTLRQTIHLYTLRIFLHIVVLTMIIGSFFAIDRATRFSQSQEETDDDILTLVYEYLPSIVITTSHIVVSIFCNKMAFWENYSPSTAVILTLLRVVFLRLVGLAVLIYTLWSKITCNGNSTARKCATCGYNHLLYECWETRVGQEMYRLTFFDFLITVAFLILVEFPRRIIVDHCSCKLAQLVGRQEFVVPTNVLALVYSQTMVWTGALFCPLLPVISTGKFIIIFYCKKITLFQNCRPALKTFRSTTSNFFFLFVLLFGWSLATVVLIYSVSSIHPSYGCGPFRYTSSMWSTIPTSFQTLPNATQEFLYFIGSEAFCIPFFVFSCVLLCYLAALASAYGKTVSLLKNQRKMEGRDKQFLVKRIKDLTENLLKENQLRKSEKEAEKRGLGESAQTEEQWYTAQDGGAAYNPAGETTGMWNIAPHEGEDYNPEGEHREVWSTTPHDREDYNPHGQDRGSWAIAQYGQEDYNPRGESRGRWDTAQHGREDYNPHGESRGRWDTAQHGRKYYNPHGESRGRRDTAQHGREYYNPHGESRGRRDTAQHGREDYNPHGEYRGRRDTAQHGREDYNPHGEYREMWDKAHHTREDYNPDGETREYFDTVTHWEGHYNPTFHPDE